MEREWASSARCCGVREERIDEERVKNVAEPLARLLLNSGSHFIDLNITILQCCRAFESAWYSPVAPIPGRATYTTVRTVSQIARHYVDGIVSANDVKALGLLFKNTDRTDQKKLLALFSTPLGQRRRLPDCCRGMTIPYTERLNLVWAFRQTEVPNDMGPDELRDVLGLVHFRRGETLVGFSYRLRQGTPIMVPTCIEAMGGWAFWPAQRDDEQLAVNYRTGARGPAEVVHPAIVPPRTMKYRWEGDLTRNWDD